jgi:hypothetical protein
MLESKVVSEACSCIIFDRFSQMKPTKGLCQARNEKSYWEVDGSDAIEYGCYKPILVHPLHRETCRCVGKLPSRGMHDPCRWTDNNALLFSGLPLRWIFCSVSLPGRQ